MKAASFAYAKPRSLPEALELLERPGAKVLAGGQSLIPALNMRLSAPELLVDITGLSLSGVCMAGKALRIGALVTHSHIESSPEIRAQVPLLAEAAPQIAHPAIRNRGTLGGSLALADPAAELPACALALNATLIIQGKKGERRVAAENFFKGLFETDLEPGEILVAAEFPTGGKSALLELTRRQGDYAIVGLAAHDSRLVFFGVGSTPVLAKAASKEKELEEAKQALSMDLKPSADLYHSPATKLHLARVLLERAWTRLSKPH